MTYYIHFEHYIPYVQWCTAIYISYLHPQLMDIGLRHNVKFSGNTVYNYNLELIWAWLIICNIYFMIIWDITKNLKKVLKLVNFEKLGHSCPTLCGIGLRGMKGDEGKVRGWWGDGRGGN